MHRSTLHGRGVAYGKAGLTTIASALLADHVAVSEHWIVWRSDGAELPNPWLPGVKREDVDALWAFRKPGPPVVLVSDVAFHGDLVAIDNSGAYWLSRGSDGGQFRLMTLQL